MNCRSLMNPFSNVISGTRVILRKYCAALLVLSFLPGFSIAQPLFEKSFQPNTIGPGSISVLQFAIINTDSVGVRNIGFTDTLPAGVSIASPANGVSDCGGLLTAPDGGNVIGFTDGIVESNQTCVITINVTSDTVGTHTNTSGSLTSDQGNSGTATADLTVDVSRPGFSKSFSPDSINFIERSTLTFLIDNSANGSIANGMRFSDQLPTGMTIADPVNASNTCDGGTLIANPGSDQLSYQPFSGLDASVAAGSTCSISVDVIAHSVGTLHNITGELTSILFPQHVTVSSGKASAILDVAINTIYFNKSFLDDPVSPGGSVTLEFTIANRDRVLSTTNMTFTDDLNTVISGLQATGLPLSDPCGPGSQLSGSSILSFTGGNIGPSESCTFNVTLSVPAGISTGAYSNVSSLLSAEVNGSIISVEAARDALFVDTIPVLSKTFLSNPVGVGDAITMEFTIVNPSDSLVVSNMAFNDNLVNFINGIVVDSLPAAGFCGAGSTMVSSLIGGEDHLIVSGASLAANGSCTFSVGLTVPVGVGNGTFTNTTGNISADINGQTRSGNSASASITVVSPPHLRKQFTDDPVRPGDTVTLEFNLHHSAEAPLVATEIAFTDDLTTVLPGLTAIGLPLNNICGAGSVIDGTTLLSFSGGSLAASEECLFSVTLQVPVDAIPGSYVNTTSGLSATLSGTASLGNPGSDNLDIDGLLFNKMFSSKAVLPGSIVDLTFTLDNTGSSLSVSNIVFVDNLAAVLSGLVALAPLPTEPCGAGSAIVGTNQLIFTGGNVLAGGSCEFTISLQVPAAAQAGTYANTTSNLTAVMAGSNVILDPAVDGLTILDQLLVMSKSFGADSVSPGDSVVLEFTINNLSSSDVVTDIAFTDDLEAVLSGFSTVGLPVNDVCGVGSQLSGSSVITLSSGILAAGGSCTFAVTLQVPSGAGSGVVLNNTTSEVTGDVGGITTGGDPASDSIRLSEVIFSKAFTAAVDPGNSTTLTFTIQNLDTLDRERINFTDNLDAVLTGLLATGLPQENVCGSGSIVSGTSEIILLAGDLAAGESCTFDVTVEVPLAASAGTYTNVTSLLFSNETVLSEPALADLIVNFIEEPTITVCHKPGTNEQQTLEVPESDLQMHLDHGDLLGACPDPNQKVTICHKPGSKAEKTLTIPESALAGHLGHGDYLGVCLGIDDDGGDDDDDDGDNDEDDDDDGGGEDDDDGGGDADADADVDDDEDDDGYGDDRDHKKKDNKHKWHKTKKHKKHKRNRDN